MKSFANKPGHEVAGTVSEKIVTDIAEAKKADLTAATVEAAMRTIEGSVRSAGLKLDYK